MRILLAVQKERVVVGSYGLGFRGPPHGPDGILVVVGHITYVLDDTHNFISRGILDPVDPEVLPNRVLVFEKVPDECLVDYSDVQRVCCVVLIKRPAQHNLGADGLEESGHHARPACARVFLGRGLGPALDANSLIPAIAAHRRIQHGGRRPHSGNLFQAVVNPAEELLHLFGLESA